MLFCACSFRQRRTSRCVIFATRKKRVCSSVVERHSDKMEADGSIPSTRTMRKLFRKIRQKRFNYKSLIDVSNVKNPEINSEVIIISSNPKDENLVIKIAQKCDTIPYEILVHIPERLKRTIL